MIRFAETESEIVAAQYEAYVYPKPVPDMAEAVRDGYWDLTDPSLFRRKLWPRNVEPDDLDILIAGCGTNQAACYAYNNPHCRVLGIDLSEASLGHQAYLKKKNNLTNLRLARMSLGDVASLGETFDLITSTGVLHHLPDPDAGLRCLRDVLRPHGVMGVMVYGRYPRLGVYMMQEVFRLLGLKQDAAGVEVVKGAINDVPEWHHLRRYAQLAPDLAYDSGLVDTFLHRLDRPYTVPEVLRFVSDNGLKLQSWLDEMDYSVSACFKDPQNPFGLRVAALSPPEQWAAVELIAQSLATHRFLLCHPGKPESDYVVDFEGEAWRGYVPSLRYRMKVLRKSEAAAEQGSQQAADAGGSPGISRSALNTAMKRLPRAWRDRGKGGLLPGIRDPYLVRRGWHTHEITAFEAALLEQVDGKRPIGEMAAALSTVEDDPELLSATREFFKRMAGWDHLQFLMP